MSKKKNHEHTDTGGTIIKIVLDDINDPRKAHCKHCGHTEKKHKEILPTTTNILPKV